MGLGSTVSSDKFHCNSFNLVSKIFVVKISRIEQYSREPQNFHPSKLIHYMVYYPCSVHCIVYIVG